MNKAYLSIAGLLMGLMSASSFAGDDYKCVIERLFISGSKTFEANQLFVKLYIGKEFTVERVTGLMAGALKNAYVNAPIVVDYGSKENSYKVLNYLKLGEGAGAGSNIYALDVMEYEEGPKKPFVFLRNSEVFFGSCTHF